MPPQIIQWLLVGSLVALCVVDSRTYRLPNRFTLPLWLLGIVWHAISPQGLGLVWSLRGAMIAVMPMLWFVLRGRMGAGDLKLMGAIGAWLGGWTALHVLAISGFAAPLLELFRRVWRTRQAGPTHPPSADSLVFDCVPDSSPRRRWIPFSIPITLGVALMVLFPGWKYPAPPERTAAPPITRAGTP